MLKGCFSFSATKYKPCRDVTPSSTVLICYNTHVFIDMTHLRCRHMMKCCLSDWVRRVCERTCTSVHAPCASQVRSIGHHQKFMYLSFTYLKKSTLLMSGIFDQTINYLVRGRLNTALPSTQYFFMKYIYIYLMFRFFLKMH